MESTQITKHGVTLTVNKPMTDEAHVVTLESRLKCSLPEDYREFLLQHNGGRPRERAFQFKLRTGVGTDSVVDWFLSIYDGEFSNLEQVLDTFRDRLPSDVLPIARDPFGNLVLLGLGGKVRGKVYFWDHELEPDGVPNWSNIDLVADSFDRFMAGLTPNEDD
jgi:cell wall assembly regulator SMI1